MSDKRTKKVKRVDLVGVLTINFTGVRDGEVVCGTNPNQSKGVEMRVRHDRLYHPLEKAAEHLIRDKFNHLAFFRAMSYEERVAWIDANVATYGARNKENHLSDDVNEGLCVKFIRIECRHWSDRLGQDEIEKLMKGNPADPDGYWPIKEIYESLRPKDKTTKATHHNLIFRPENWQVKSTGGDTQYNGAVVIRHDSVCYDNTRVLTLPYGTSFQFKTTNSGETIALLYDKPLAPTRMSDLMPLIAECLSKEEYQQCDAIAQLMSQFTPSAYKSLMQKIIRTRCCGVSHDNVVYSARAFLLMTLARLALHAGAFNPNTQRFISGFESATKRLAVIIQEDSCVANQHDLTRLLIDALIKKNDLSWMPPLQHFTHFFRVALEALDSWHYLEYTTHKDFGHDKLGQVDVINYVLLKEIGSMPGDIAFFSDIAKHGAVIKTCTSPMIWVMPLIHCIDQHCNTSIAHFMPYADKQQQTSHPFENLFSQIWYDLSSYNGRKGSALATSQFIESVRFAQECIFQQKYSVSCSELTPADMPEEQEFMYRIDTTWLAGLIGPIEVELRNNVRAIVVLRVDNIDEMIVIRKPTCRGASSSSDLTMQQKEHAISLAKELLQEGVALKHIPATLQSQFAGARVLLDDDYHIMVNGEKKLWSDATEIKQKLTLYDPGMIDDYKQWCRAAAASFKNGDGYVARDAVSKLETILSRYSQNVLKRLYMYMSNYRPVIKLYDISRDGSSVKLDVSYDDIAVNHLLCAICVLFPHTLALVKDGFQVKNALLWSIRDLVKKQIVHVPHVRGWKIEQCERPAMMSHQEDSLKEMTKKNEAGKRGHAIFIDVGLGKTRISMEFLAWLVAHDKMPRFAVYTAPPAAIINAEKEFAAFGIPFCRMVTRENKLQKDHLLQEYKINILEHDQMRRTEIYSQLKASARDMLFIVDEFHMTTACNTIRSSIALEISRLSYDFIAMTGTLIRNESVAELIPWLEQIVDFYVNHHNYLVAFGALISRKANTGVIVNMSRDEAPFEKQEQEDYYAMIPPKLGGSSASKMNFQKVIHLCYMAMTRRMILTIVEQVERGEIVFVLTHNIAHQEEIKQALIERLVVAEHEIFLINAQQSLTLKPEDTTPIKVILTTLKHTMGYTLTKCRVSITGVYPSNQATRTQFEGRTNRLGQLSPSVEIITIHCGLLSYMLACYARAKSYADALKEFASYVDIDYETIRNAL